MIRGKNRINTLMSLGLALLAAAFIFSTQARADELSDLREKLQKLEERFNDELSFQKEERLALFEQLDEAIKLNMYIGLDYESFEASRSTFKADSLELVSEIQLQNKMAAFFELEFKGEAAEVEQAWFEYLVLPAFNPRFGAILVPFGAYNLDHFNYRRALAHRPVAMKHIVPVTWREAGLGFTGKLFIESEGGQWAEELGLDYQFFLVNGLTESFEPVSSRKARGGLNQDNNNKALVGRIGLTLNGLNTLGFSTYQGKYDLKSRKTLSGLDVDWQIQHGPFGFLGEIARFHLQAPGDLPKSLEGGYAQINYRFWPQFLQKSRLGRDLEDPHLLLVLRFGEAVIQGDFGQNRETRWTGGINYRPYPSFVTRIEYQWNQTSDQALEHGDDSGLILSFAAAF